ncbi:hypothetical protein FOA52_007163 [Chlamydomonas sp. UWO 241]|nr:hypothetical protein FOA52_007163 [Chlamydomonas sp. UWO 241]
MAPKRVKKTKEELEEERRVAEEEARKAEEERLREEAAERARLAEIEAQRVALLETLLAKEEELRVAERDELAPLLGMQAAERARAREQSKKDWEWERYLSCTYVPHPENRKHMAEFMDSMATVPPAHGGGGLGDALAACQDAYQVIGECALFEAQARLDGDDTARETFASHAKQLHELVGGRIDSISARLLHFSDEHPHGKDVCPQTGMVQGDFSLGLWVNTAKNPRIKNVELAAISTVIDVPKQIALASIALRVVRRTRDEFFSACTNEYMALGGVVYADLLSLPPAARKAGGWSMRAVTPLATSVHRVPYPIPPAGADPHTFRSEEEPLPLGLSFSFDAPSLLLGAPEELAIGWWDTDACAWSTSGVTEPSISVDASGVTKLSVHTTHMGPIAVLAKRTARLPYKAWYVRPTGGRGGATAAISLDVGGPTLLTLDAGPGYVSLAPCAGAAWPALAALVGKRMPPGSLLAELSTRGMHLLPEDRDAPFVGARLKDPSVERAMCAELGLLSGVCLIARARWNSSATADECIARISEVVDWEEGGRTEQSHAERVFNKEREDGDKRVLCVMARGGRGFAFIDAADKRGDAPGLPGHGTVEDVQACMVSVFGEVRAGLLSLLKGPHYTSDELEAGPLPARLRLSTDALSLSNEASPLLSETVGHMLLLLRVFSFS